MKGFPHKYSGGAEDGLGDTVKPRLIEAGADLDRVLVIDDSEVQLTLSDERIEKAIIENNARLVIIDPIQAYLGADVDMNRANEVRPIFMRLGQVAQRTGRGAHARHGCRMKCRCSTGGPAQKGANLWG